MTHSQSDNSEITNIHSSEAHSEGIKTLLGDPKKALFKLGLPMIIGMSMQTLYNLADAIWVSGLGPNALSSVGFFFPFFMVAISLSVGLGAGGGSAVSRYIGAKNKKDADSTAVHTLICMLILTILFTTPFILLSKPIFRAMGAGDALDMTVSYAQIMFGGSIFIFFLHAAMALLRAEGDAKRPMYLLFGGSILNIILDPIFIYTFKLGVAGAAIASIVSMGCTSLVLFYWVIIKSSTYVTISFKSFSFRKRILAEILKVAIPSSFAQISMAVMMLFLNIILVAIKSNNGVAVLMTGWRIVMIATLPIIGMATALISISGAAFGAKDYKKLEITYIYAVKMGILIEAVLGAIIFIAAPYITRLFTWSEHSALLFDDIVRFVRIMCFFYPAAVLGIFSSSLFQGVGKGINAFIITLFRTIILSTPLAWLFGIALKGNLTGIWYGMLFGTWIAALFAFGWVRLYIRNLKKTKMENSH